MEKINLFWFRRDLRLEDNAGLYHALKGDLPVLPIFIFDINILEKLEDKKDARVEFIYTAIVQLSAELKKLGSTIRIEIGQPKEIYQKLIGEYEIKTVYTNRDYEPYAKNRDKEVEELLKAHDIRFHKSKDHVIFELAEVLKDDGSPYTVFTPYSKKWKAKLGVEMSKRSTSFFFKSYPCKKYQHNFFNSTPFPLPSLEELGFISSGTNFPALKVKQGLIKNYDKTRDFPAILGTSRLGIHFRFGTISIREKARKASLLNETYLNELIWRDFYAMILDHFPHVEKRSFRAKYDLIEWRNNEQEFEKWCQGQTGYPIVDAGMRELNATGYMHNRVRMITASFLTKHLLIDWKWGEAYFAEKLLDFDLASNNGGWQWAAGSGTDAAPYFRIFNPTSQQQKFDKEFKYIKKWVPEYGTSNYCQPIVDHKEARARCLEVYKSGLDKAKV